MAYEYGRFEDDEGFDDDDIDYEIQTSPGTGGVQFIVDNTGSRSSSVDTTDIDMNPVTYFRTMQQQIHEWMQESSSSSSSSLSSSSMTTASFSPVVPPLLPTASSVLPSIGHPFYSTRLHTVASHSTASTSGQPSSSRLSPSSSWVYQYGNQYISMNGLLVALIKEGKQYQKQQEQQKDSVMDNTNTNSHGGVNPGADNSSNRSSNASTNPAYLSVMLTNGLQVQGVLVYVDNDTNLVLRNPVYVPSSVPFPLDSSASIVSNDSSPSSASTLPSLPRTYSISYASILYLNLPSHVYLGTFLRNYFRKLDKQSKYRAPRRISKQTITKMG